MFIYTHIHHMLTHTHTHTYKNSRVTHTKPKFKGKHVLNYLG